MNGEPQLRSLSLTLRRRPGPLRPQVIAALGRHGRPVRWAITAIARSAAPVGEGDPAKAGKVAAGHLGHEEPTAAQLSLHGFQSDLITVEAVVIAPSHGRGHTVP